MPSKNRNVRMNCEWKNTHDTKIKSHYFVRFTQTIKAINKNMRSLWLRYKMVAPNDRIKNVAFLCMATCVRQTTWYWFFIVFLFFFLQMSTATESLSISCIVRSNRQICCIADDKKNVPDTVLSHISNTFLGKKIFCIFFLFLAKAKFGISNIHSRRFDRLFYSINLYLFKHVI